MSHTPTPWTMNDKGPGIEGPRFTVDGHDERGPWLVATVTRPCDAALIVRAVNSHAELLEAARMAHRVLLQMNDHEDYTIRTINDLSAALKKAEAKP